MKQVLEHSKMFSRKKGAMGVNAITPIVISLGIAILFGVVMMIVLAGMGEQTTDPNATQLITDGKEGMLKIFGFFVVIGLVVGAGIVIGILVKSFGGK